MIYLIIGHRGVGKTSLLSRIQKISPSILGYDLDRCIEAKTGRNLAEIFTNLGEENFRQLEIETLMQLLEECQELGPNRSIFISLGAGFCLGKIQQQKSVFNFKCLWLMRDTDFDGRIFFNRPRLNPDLDPLTEYQMRAQEREKNYFLYCDQTYVMNEGLHIPDELELDLILFKKANCAKGASLTLLPKPIFNLKEWQTFIQDRLLLGFDFFEIRDDLFKADEIKQLFKLIPKDRILFSFRCPKASPIFFTEIKKSGVKTDWALELGDPPERCDFLSLHPDFTSAQADINQSLESLIKWEEQSKIKISPLLENLEDLSRLHNWQKQAPDRRALLPRSNNPEGRWAWYRLLMKNQMPLNFVREGRGFNKDQPSLMNWVKTLSEHQGFGAVVGSPIHHSYSVSEQQPFYANKKMNFFAVDLKKGELTKGLHDLAALGLKALAVTSPLKEEAYLLAPMKHSTRMEGLGVANTLALKNTPGMPRLWLSENTDFVGLASLIKVYGQGLLAVWGGGGTLPPIRSLAPGAYFFSSRTGELKAGPTDNPIPNPQCLDYRNLDFQTLIWAAPNPSQSAFKMPPVEWQPKVIIDLNYRENSYGRLYALELAERMQTKVYYQSGFNGQEEEKRSTMSLTYIGGEELFFLQAQGQRNFWGKHL